MSIFRNIQDQVQHSSPQNFDIFGTVVRISPSDLYNLSNKLQAIASERGSYFEQELERIKGDAVDERFLSGYRAGNQDARALINMLALALSTDKPITLEELRTLRLD